MVRSLLGFTTSSNDKNVSRQNSSYLKSDVEHQWINLKQNFCLKKLTTFSLFQTKEYLADPSKFAAAAAPAAAAPAAGGGKGAGKKEEKKPEPEEESDDDMGFGLFD